MLAVRQDILVQFYITDDEIRGDVPEDDETIAFRILSFDLGVNL